MRGESPIKIFTKPAVKNLVAFTVNLVELFTYIGKYVQLLFDWSKMGVGNCIQCMCVYIYIYIVHFGSTAHSAVSAKVV